MKKRKKTTDTSFIIVTTILTGIGMYFLTSSFLEAKIWTISFSSLWQFLLAAAFMFYLIALFVNSIKN